MPPELLRKGRFDEIFFIGLPSNKEKELIFKVHLSRLRPKSWNLYDIPYLTKLAKNFSGAEVEESIIEAMHIAFSENREFTTADIASSIEQFIPLAELNSEKIDVNKTGYFPDIGVTKLYVLGKEIVNLLKHEEGILKI